MSSASVEVCIVTYSNAETVAECVKSAAMIAGVSGIAVHDNNPQSPSIAAARSAAEFHNLPFRSETCPENCGFAAGCNSLVKDSSADYILFLNPDAKITKWDQSVTGEPGIHGAVLYDASGQRQQRQGTGTFTLLEEAQLRLLRRLPTDPAGFGYVSGAAMLLSRSDFDGLGGFDQNFYMYYEDIDLCVRAGERGLPVDVAIGIEVVHIGGHSAGSDFGLAQLRSYESSRYFHAKRGHREFATKMLFLVDALLRMFWFSVASGRRTVAAKAYRSLAVHILTTWRSRITMDPGNAGSRDGHCS